MFSGQTVFAPSHMTLTIVHAVSVFAVHVCCLSQGVGGGGGDVHELDHEL